MRGGRQAGGDAQQALLHELARAHQLGPLLEDHHHRRQPEHRLRAERAQSGHAVHGVLERDGDEALDFAGGEAGRLRLDLDQRRRELREHVERRVLRRARPGDDQDERQRDDDEAQAERAFDEPAHHGRLLSRAEFDAEQLRRAVGHDARTGGGPLRQHREAPGDIGDHHALTHIDARLPDDVHPRAAVRIVQQRGLGDDEAGLGLAARQADRDALAGPEAIVRIRAASSRDRRRLSWRWPTAAPAMGCAVTPAASAASPSSCTSAGALVSMSLASPA